MLETEEIEEEVIEALKNIVDDDIKKIDKKSRTVEFNDGTVYYILTEDDRCNYFYQTSAGFVSVPLPELLNGFKTLDPEAVDVSNEFNDKIGNLVERTIGFDNYIEANNLIAHSDEEEIRLPQGYFAFRVE